MVAGDAHRFVDIGANLLDSMFEGDYRGKKAHPPDIDAVLARAAGAGVERAIVTAGTLDESRHALEFVRAQRRAGSPVQLFCTIGVHPTRSLEFLPPEERTALEAAMQACADAGDSSEEVASAARSKLAELERACTTPDSPAGVRVAAHVKAHVKALETVLSDARADGVAVAVGECGLDYDRLQFCPAGVQRLGFEAQLELAHTCGLPLFLHNRATGGDFARLCVARAAQLRHGGVVHSFDGDVTEVEELVGLGLHIGLNGCSLKTAQNLGVAARVPLSALHLETDAPWCGIRRTHAGYAHVRPFADPASGTPYPEVKKEKWAAGACVKDRSEPGHIVQVLQVVSGARREAAVDDAGAHSVEEEEARVAEAAYANSLRIFWPSEAPQT